MKRTAIIAIIFLFLIMACDNSSSDSTADSNTYTVTYSAVGPDVSKFIGWEWAKEDSDFTYVFQPDGTVSVIHCCGELFEDQFNYLFRGNVLVTYGSEMDVDKIEVTNFTMTEDGLSFTLDDGTSFTRGESSDPSSSGSNLNLSNVLLGTWKVENGTEYVFGSDASLKINSDQYGYLVRKNELLTLGALVDGTQVVLQRYKYVKKEGNLFLQYNLDGKTYNIILSGL